MITYHALGYWAVLGLPAALLALRLTPRGTRAHQFLARTILGALAVIAAIVALSY
ncbi:hypothetical protein [Streptomyces antimycoticus]|uniref:hypothetical protein n=1 Tax=Streptomyces antimycoticus TaxID=68175 RepID=UPI0025701C93|nr:hypothetical protein [Streptomyces antimycoticus]WJD99755.1 hypothetical protein QR300_29320 [Streptomyces antimycoticus]